MIEIFTSTEVESISVLEILIIALLIFVQSIFGVGLLLFGTPTFLYFSYSFTETLFILLPISLTISLIQFLNSKHKDSNFIYKFNLITLPSLAISLFLVVSFFDNLNIKIYIATMLIIVSLLSILFERKFKNFLNKKTNSFFLSLIGLTHGFTNLGGGFLVLYADALTDKKKQFIRYYISYGYLIMSLIQLIILFILSPQDFNSINLVYIFFVFFIYLPGQFFFRNINRKKFSLIIKFIALMYGFIVIFW